MSDEAPTKQSVRFTDRLCLVRVILVLNVYADSDEMSSSGGELALTVIPATPAAAAVGGVSPEAGAPPTANANGSGSRPQTVSVIAPRQPIPNGLNDSFVGSGTGRRPHTKGDAQFDADADAEAEAQADAVLLGGSDDDALLNDYNEVDSDPGIISRTGIGTGTGNGSALAAAGGGGAANGAAAANTPKSPYTWTGPYASHAAPQQPCWCTTCCGGGLIIRVPHIILVFFIGIGLALATFFLLRHQGMTHA